MGRGVTSAPESPGMEMLARLPVSPMRSRGVRGVAAGSMSSCAFQGSKLTAKDEPTQRVRLGNRRQPGVDVVLQCGGDAECQSRAEQIGRGSTVLTSGTCTGTCRHRDSRLAAQPGDPVCASKT